MSTVITVENLGKKYTLHHQQREQYTALRDVISNGVRNLSKKIFSPFTPHSSPLSASEDFWALKDVCFEVKQGDRIGIIGRNGAGKSTLLKILSRITEPTTGSVRIKGRVASLLEVGTGFHPELTGRENIFLNGAILGMGRAEIKKKFDEIVDFAEIEKFLDTPVKRYSSGMYVRLAFAVAAHLEPEILIVDEVLAVGDAQFQKKCLGKMEDVSREGRTLLFVSHNMGAIENLCSGIMLLDKGNLCQYSTDVRSIITRYLNWGSEERTITSTWTNDEGRYKHPVMQPLSFSVVDSQGDSIKAAVPNDQSLFVIIRAFMGLPDPSLSVGFALYNEESELLLWSLTTDVPENSWPKIEPGIVELRCALPKRFLNEGVYRLVLNAGLHCTEWFIRPTLNSPVIYFEIRGGLSDSPYWMWARPGFLAPEWKWERTA
jgi:lipopolysaccharide transport system ATP-binding protein